MRKTSSVILTLIFTLCTVALFGCGGESGGASNELNGEVINGCDNCGSEYTVEITARPETFKDGERTYTCQSCGHIKTEKLQRTGAISVLFIADSYTIDCSTHLEDMLKAVGAESITLANLNIMQKGGATLTAQKNSIDGVGGGFTLSVSKNGKMKYEYSVSVDFALDYNDWDYIILQQSVPTAGIIEEYEPLDPIAQHIKSKCAEAKILWNMGWAFDNDCKNEDFEKYGSTDQMYLDIISAVCEEVIPCDSIQGVLPIGTAIQNIRSALNSDSFLNNGEKLSGSNDDLGLIVSSLCLCYGLTEKLPEFESLELAADGDYLYRNKFNLAKESVMNAYEKPYEQNAPKAKSIKLLIFGNSYGNDATAYLGKMLYEGGYTNVVIGHAGESSMTINDHYHNIDDDPSNDYIYASSGLPFSVHYKTVNGKSVQMEADYKAIVMDEEWDYIIFYQGPNNAATLVEDQYYSELDGFVTALKKYSTNPECKILYYMTWAHCVTDTFALYDGIVSVTERLIKQSPNIDGIIPAATLIQNLRTGYLNAGNGGDINRDWGHLNYGVGRYSMALLFYRYLTGSDASEITYMPNAEDIEPGLVHQFTDVESNLDIILECVDNALSTPMKLTQSKYTEK